MSEQTEPAANPDLAAISRLQLADEILRVRLMRGRITLQQFADPEYRREVERELDEVTR